MTKPSELKTYEMPSSYCLNLYSNRSGRIHAQLQNVGEKIRLHKIDLCYASGIVLAVSAVALMILTTPCITTAVVAGLLAGAGLSIISWTPLLKTTQYHLIYELV